MHPVTLLLPPPQRHTAPTFSAPPPFLRLEKITPSPNIAEGITGFQALQAQAYLAQIIAQEYLPSGLTIEPHGEANNAYRRQVPPVGKVDISA